MTVETLNMKDLEITIIRKPIKNMYLRVRRSGDIEISASPHITQEMIESFVLAKWSWIMAKRQAVLSAPSQTLETDEILYFGYRILENNPTALYALRVKFPFIFVDKFQDTNPLQTLLVKLIGQKSTKIIVVGDIAQSIYSFQGAKPSDFNDFCID